MIVRASGRTEMIWENPQHAPNSSVTMQVHQGLTCAFAQHAAIVDASKSQLCLLGNVGKTMVVTPQLPDDHDED